MRYKLLLVILSYFCFQLQAQNVLPIGSWRTHFPQRTGSYVTQSSTQLFYVAAGAIMVLDKDEIAPRFLTKVDGLSNVDIQLLQYHEPTETLVVVYESGVVDLVRKDGEVVTVNAIRNFTNITGEKRVNQVFVAEDNTLLMATTFGVSAFRVEEGIFPFTTFMGALNVRAVAQYEGFIYAGTEEGIYRIAANNAAVEDFAAWEFLDNRFGFPAEYTSQAMGVYEGELYVGVNEDIYRWEDNAASLFADLAVGHDLHYMTAEGAHLLVGYRCNNGGVCDNGRVYYYRADGSGGRAPANCIEDIGNAVEDEQGRIWFGDRNEDFRYLANINDTDCRRFDFDAQGPSYFLAWDLAYGNDALWTATGAISETNSPQFVDQGAGRLQDGSWVTYNRRTNETFRGRNPDPNFRSDDVFTVIDVEVNEVTNKVYAASYYAGLLEIDGENVSLIDDENSPLRNTQGDDSRTRVSGLKADEEGNLWVSNYTPVEGAALHRLAPDGTWTSFPDTDGATELFQIDIDPNGYKWVVDRGNRFGVLVYDEGEINNPNDDRRRVFTSTNSNVPTNKVNCLTVDNDGDVWVGTNAGIVIFECGAAAFDENCVGSLRIVELDGFLEFLFKTQVILSLAVDGANRKWVGTANNGVYLISADGKETLAQFTETNSPLPGNAVRSLAINPQTGEVFMGTEDGLVSYQSDAVQGTRVNTNRVQVFPNPVRPDYDGPIAIKGLAENANVKITDVNGKLVNEFQALGGQAIWNGRDYNGRRVQTGVYLVFASTNPREVGALAQPDGIVTKIVFVN